MAPRLLLELAADVDRLLAAGADAPGGSGEFPPAPLGRALGRRAREVRALAKQAPALAPLAEALGRVGQGRPAALLDLVALLRQVRAALASSGVEGEMTPVP